MAEPEQFLARWSRLKRKARDGAVADPPPAAAPEAVPAAPAPPAEPLVPDLPPLESLTKDSDFTPFLRPGVPDALRKAALRKLYESDPVFANLDGLLEYGEDFAEPFRAAGVITTAYRVLKGMPGGAEETEGAAETTTAAAADLVPDTSEAAPSEAAVESQDKPLSRTEGEGAPGSARGG